MKKIITSAILLIALMAATTGTVFAQETTPFTGTVQSVVLETDPDTGDPVVIVEVYNDADGTTQSFTLSVEYAESLGLVSSDPATGEPVVNDSAVGSTVEVDPAEDLNSAEEDDEGDGEGEHPVGSKLNEFFSDLVGVDYDTIMEYHDDGFGFGVIAQALWFANNDFEGNEELTFTALLEAKASGDYSGIVLADGSTPSNWGDIVKANKKGENLGYVMSGKGDSEGDTEESVGKSNGNGKGSDKGNNGNHGNNGNNGKGKEKSGNKGGNGKNK